MNTSHQRTLLPYRLERDAKLEEILESFEWDDDLKAEVRSRGEQIVVNPEGAWFARQEMLAHMRNVLEEQTARILHADFVAACKVVWLFEREWMFLHGFALVPVRREVAA